MSTLYPPAAGAASGQAANAPAAGQSGPPAQTPVTGQQPPAAPAYVTVEEAQRIASEAAEQAFRRSQSLTEKIRQGIENQLATLRQQSAAAGAPLTAEQERVLRGNLEAQAVQQAEPFATPSQPAQAGPAPASSDPVLDAAFALMRSAGVMIEETDPEFAGIKQDGTPSQFLDGVAQAIAAKQQRLGGRENPTARVPLGGPGLPAGSPEPKTADEAWARVTRTK